MQHLQVSDQLFTDAHRQAVAQGFSKVEDYLAVLVHEDAESTAAFTPEVLQDIKQIASDIDAGAETYTLQEAEDRIAKSREQWGKDKAS